MGGFAVHPGERFGRLTAVELIYKVSRSGRRRAHWQCQCDCGGTAVVDSGNLRNGNTRWCRACSSNHKSTHRRTHGHTVNTSPTRAYSIWCGMKARIYNPNNRRFADYGGRGIEMCRGWTESFEKFLKDMGEPPTADHQIERIDNSKGYMPENCVWADRFEQAANKRNNRVIEARGEAHILADWSRLTGLKQTTIARRLRLGWTTEAALFTPNHGSRQKYVWRTPEGDFATITDVAAHYGMPLRTVSSRFSSPSFPGWKREGR